MWMSMTIPLAILLSVGRPVAADTYRLNPESGSLVAVHDRHCDLEVRAELERIIALRPVVEVVGDLVALQATTVFVPAHRSVVGQGAYGFWDVRPGRLIAASIHADHGNTVVTLSILHRSPDIRHAGLADSCYETWEGTAELDPVQMGGRP